jgi:hypothetical protein
MRIVGVELFHGNVRTNMTNLEVRFRNFANAPKKCIHVLVWKRAEKRCLEDLSMVGKIILKTIVWKILCWIYLAQINDQWPSVANILMNFELYKMRRISWLADVWSFSRLTLLDGDRLLAFNLNAYYIYRTYCVSRQVEPSIADIICSTSWHNILRDIQQRNTTLATCLCCN